MAAHTRQIMAYEQHRHPRFCAEPINQVHNLMPERGIKRRCRFIGHKERGTMRNGSGDHHPLALPTR
jgi:hypothetical protein